MLQQLLLQEEMAGDLVVLLTDKIILTDQHQYAAPYLPLLCCSSWNDGAYEFALENQAGEGLRFEDPQDRQALVMGLALHEQGKQILEKVLLPQRLTQHHFGIPPAAGGDLMSCCHQSMHHWQSSCVLEGSYLVGNGSTAAMRHDTHGFVHESLVVSDIPVSPLRHPQAVG